MLHGVSSVDHLPAWLAFIGALAVALIAAGTSQWRQRADLRAQDRRLDRRLRHDRELQDLAEVRALLDSIVAHVTAVVDALAEVRLLVHVMVETPNVHQQQAGTETVRRGWDSHEPLRGDWDRLALRLGDDHPACQALAALRARTHQALSVPSRGSGPFTDEQRSAMASAMQEINAAAERFLAEAHSAAGARLED
jgi:hypothetical protein